MTITEWRPDSCQCIIHIKHPERILVKVIKKCHLHKDKSGKKLHDAISSHNKKFSKLEQIDKRREEYERIEKMGKPSSQPKKEEKVCN